MTVKHMRLAGRQHEAGVKAIIVDDLRWARRDIKTIQLLPNCLAKQAAAEQGAYEAIMADRLKPFISAYAMFDMHNQIANLQRGYFFQKIICPAPAPRWACDACPENILFCQHQNIIPLKALLY